MRFLQRRAACVMGIAMAAFSASLTSAQTATTGTLTGTITDASGSVLPGVRVVAVNEATNESREAISGGDGLFVIPLLGPGRYRVDATLSGFKTKSHQSAPINVAESTRLDIRLEVGRIEELVSVVATPLLVQTEMSALGRVVDERVIENLPLVTRNFTQILALSPGISAGVTNASEFGRGSGGLVGSDSAPQVHGARSSDNNFQMDGVPVNDYQNSGAQSGGPPIPNPDTIQEFKVQTGQYDATFGRNAGANVNIVTKSGQNRVFGSLFEFFRDDALNATEFFFKRAGQPKPVLRQHQPGFTLGGPLKRDKLLFFTSHQATRQTNGVAGSGSGRSRTAVFSPPLSDDRSAAALGALFAGQRGVLQGASGPAILPDGSNIHPIALRLLQMRLPNGSYLLPTPQVVDRTQPFARQGFSAFSIPSTYDENQLMLNLDYQHTAKSKFEARSFVATSDANASLPGGNVPGFPRVTEELFLTGSISHKYIVTSSLLNELRVGFFRSDVDSRQQTAFEYSDLGILTNDQGNDLPNINIVGSYNPAVLFPLRFDQNTFALTESLFYTRGNHTLRLGIGLTHTQDNVSKFRSAASMTFLSFPDFLLGLDGVRNGSGFSSVFFSGDSAILIDRNYRLWDTAVFVQDDFKIAPRLTLNAGLRYERIGHLADKLGKNVYFDPSRAAPNPPSGGTLAGFVVPSNFREAIPAGVTQIDNELGIAGKGQHTWAPRLGFAWQVLPGSQRVVLRGGYGIYFTRLPGQSSSQGAFGPPYTVFRFTSGVQNASASLDRPFELPVISTNDLPVWTPYSPTTNLTLSTISPDYRPPMTQQYSVNTQIAAARDYLVEVGYVGTRGTHLVRGRSVNQALSATPSQPIRGVTTNTVANVRERVPILGFTPTGISQVESEGESWYNALELSVTKRFSRGSQFLAAYTFSHAVDTDGANVNGTNSGGMTIGDQNDPRARYGPAHFNRPHRLVASYVYELPFKADTGALKQLLDGWSVAGVVVVQSGQRLTLTGTNATNVYGISSDRAQLAAGCSNDDLISQGSVSSRLNNYFNRNCIAPYAVIGSDGRGTDFGNSGVGIVSGPGQRNVDIAIVKRSRMGWPTAAASLELRGELFNAFNWAQFANPDTNTSSATFGQISATSVSPRIVQLAIKFNF